MRNAHPKPTLGGYSQWLRKAEHDLRQFRTSGHPYDIANCLLSLNALWDWVINDPNSPHELIAAAKAKRNAVSSVRFDIDEMRRGSIDHKLKLVRMFCNHAKHGAARGSLKSIALGALYPAAYPIRFDHLILDDASVDANVLAADVIAFWRIHIPKRARQGGAR
jgi:hypothetical protein